MLPDEVASSASDATEGQQYDIRLGFEQRTHPVTENINHVNIIPSSRDLDAIEKYDPGFSIRFEPILFESYRASIEVMRKNSEFTFEKLRAERQLAEREQDLQLMIGREERKLMLTLALVEKLVIFLTVCLSLALLYSLVMAGYGAYAWPLLSLPILVKSAWSNPRMIERLSGFFKSKDNKNTPDST